MRPQESLKAALPLLQAGHFRGQRGVSRLVVGTDFSLRSEFALARALRLPLGQGGVFCVMHAAPLLDGPEGAVCGERCLRKATASVCRRLRHRVDVDVHEAWRRGEPVEAVSAVSGELRAELVVLGRPHVTYPVKELRTTRWCGGWCGGWALRCWWWCRTRCGRTRGRWWRWTSPGSPGGRWS